jgi:hypothetical protein
VFTKVISKTRDRMKKDGKPLIRLDEVLVLASAVVGLAWLYSGVILRNSDAMTVAAFLTTASLLWFVPGFRPGPAAVAEKPAKSVE